MSRFPVVLAILATPALGQTCTTAAEVKPILPCLGLPSGAVERGALRVTHDSGRTQEVSHARKDVQMN